MTIKKVTHYGMPNRRTKYDYYTMSTDKRLGIIVYGWGTYETGVLKGQAMKKFLASFDTEAEAIAVYGDMNFSSKWTEPTVSLSHLPGENDPVPGGMYPDDYVNGTNGY